MPRMYNTDSEQKGVGARNPAGGTKPITEGARAPKGPKPSKPPKR